jgi:enoyl-CoA hydratase/carnithine racemase
MCVGGGLEIASNCDLRCCTESSRFGIPVNRLADPVPLTAAELDRSYLCFDTEDFQIGTEAFRSKTQPMFKGR